MLSNARTRFCQFFYELFFLAYGLAYFFGPPVILLVAGSLPRVGRSTRVLIGVGVATLLLAPIMIFVGWQEGLLAAGGALLVTACIWTPQFGMLWWMWQVHFRRTNRRKPHTRKRAIRPVKHLPERLDLDEGVPEEALDSSPASPPNPVPYEIEKPWQRPAFKRVRSRFVLSEGTAKTAPLYH